MKAWLDWLPVVAFFAVYQWDGIYSATATAMAVAVVQTVVSWVVSRQVGTVQWMTLLLILVFGGATLWLQDPIFIKWKPTLVQWMLAGLFLGSHWIGGQLMIRRLVGHQILLPDPQWVRLNVAWVLFFALSGAANLVVAYRFEERIWVNFKMFGLLGMTLLFVIAQGWYLAKHLQEPPADS